MCTHIAEGLAGPQPLWFRYTLKKISCSGNLMYFYPLCVVRTVGPDKIDISAIFQAKMDQYATFFVCLF